MLPNWLHSINVTSATIIETISIHPKKAIILPIYLGRCFECVLNFPLTTSKPGPSLASFGEFLITEFPNVFGKRKEHAFLCLRFVFFFFEFLYPTQASCGPSGRPVIDAKKHFAFLASDHVPAGKSPFELVTRTAPEKRTHIREQPTPRALIHSLSRCDFTFAHRINEDKLCNQGRLHEWFFSFEYQVVQLQPKCSFQSESRVTFRA